MKMMFEYLNQTNISRGAFASHLKVQLNGAVVQPFLVQISVSINHLVSSLKFYRCQRKSASCRQYGNVYIVLFKGISSTTLKDTRRTFIPRARIQGRSSGLTVLLNATCTRLTSSSDSELKRLHLHYFHRH
jgi:hypothetical protein